MGARSFYFSVAFMFMSIPAMESSGNASANTITQFNIGALVSYETLIGQVAKQAIEMAVDDVNRDQSVLNGSQLVLHMLDTNCSALQGAASGMFFSLHFSYPF